MVYLSLLAYGCYKQNLSYPSDRSKDEVKSSNEVKTENKFDQEESGKISVLVNLSTHSSSLLPLPQQQPYSQQIHQQHHPQQLYHQQIPYHGQHYAQPPPPQYNSLVQKQQQFNVFKPQLKRVLSPVRQQQQQQQHQEPLQSIPLPLQIDDLKQQPRHTKDLHQTEKPSLSQQQSPPSVQPINSPKIRESPPKIRETTSPVKTEYNITQQEAKPQAVTQPSPAVKIESLEIPLPPPATQQQCSTEVTKPKDEIKTEGCQEDPAELEVTSKISGEITENQSPLEATRKKFSGVKITFSHLAGRGRTQEPPLLQKFAAAAPLPDELDCLENFASVSPPSGTDTAATEPASPEKEITAVPPATAVDTDEDVEDDNAPTSMELSGVGSFLKQLQHTNPQPESDQSKDFIEDSLETEVPYSQHRHRRHTHEEEEYGQPPAKKPMMTDTARSSSAEQYKHQQQEFWRHNASGFTSFPSSIAGNVLSTDQQRRPYAYRNVSPYQQYPPTSPQRPRFPSARGRGGNFRGNNRQFRPRY